MCERSNSPARLRTASCSLRMPAYCTGISNPPNGTIRAASARCASYSAVRRSVPLISVVIMVRCSVRGGSFAPLPSGSVIGFRIDAFNVQAEVATLVRHFEETRSAFRARQLEPVRFLIRTERRVAAEWIDPDEMSKTVSQKKPRAAMDLGKLVMADALCERGCCFVILRVHNLSDEIGILFQMIFVIEVVTLHDAMVRVLTVLVDHASVGQTTRDLTRNVRKVERCARYDRFVVLFAPLDRRASDVSRADAKIWRRY